MAREDNFKESGKETQFKSGQEAVENGKKGGVASGISRRKGRLLKDIAQSILDSPVQDEQLIEKVLQTFPELERDQVTQSYLMLSDVYEILRKRKKTKDKDGELEELVPAYAAADRLKAFQILEASAGQKPTEKQEIQLANTDRIEVRIDGDEIE